MLLYCSSAQEHLTSIQRALGSNLIRILGRTLSLFSWKVHRMEPLWRYGILCVDQVLCTEEHKCTLSMDDVSLDGLKCEIWCNDLEHTCSFQGGGGIYVYVG